MDGYGAESDIHAYERSQMDMVRYARIVLLVTAVLQGLLALGVVVGFVGIALGEGLELEEQLAAGVGGVCAGLIVLVLGVIPSVAAAVGLGRGARWGWIATIVVGVLNIVPCCSCLPLGAFLLYAMLNDEVRQAFSPEP